MNKGHQVDHRFGKVLSLAHSLKDSGQDNIGGRAALQGAHSSSSLSLLFVSMAMSLDIRQVVPRKIAVHGRTC